MDRYFLKIEFSKNWEEFTKQEYMRAERECGFYPKIHGQPANAYFSANCLKGRIEYDQPDSSKREDRYIGGYFPPPWNSNEHPEKTEGWIAFQEEQRKDPKYYGCGTRNSRETD